MPLSPFHAYYFASALSSYAYGREKLAAAFAASDIEIYPFQVAAARFALRSPFLKGAVLCDDGSLGKTYEALLAVTQKWYEDRQKILIVVPTPLLGQWVELIDRRFAVPLFTVADQRGFQKFAEAGQTNPFRQAGLVITTYDFAAEKAEFIGQIEWDAVVFEEAHHLRRVHTGENKKVAAIAEAVNGAFKLLLTATPIQNSIMDLYGLINFIDDQVFYDEAAFYRRYFRKPENYDELAERVRPFCFRTRRDQVENYVKIPQRLPLTVEYSLTKPEQTLHQLLDAYLKKPDKIAFPKMDRYDLTLMLFRSFSSSPAAFESTLRGVVKRLEKMRAEGGSAAVAQELAEFHEMLRVTESLATSAKAEALLTTLQQSLAELKKLGAAPKALIFTDNVSTQKYLYTLLDQGPYKGKVLLFNGSNSRDYTLMASFRDRAQIMIATDLAAEGFNLEFCPLVINYDLPYNALQVEQRVSRCHRQGQQSDVMVVNFLNRDNFADVRLLELINKRSLQFGGIFGLADDWLGDFSRDLAEGLGRVLSLARSKADIDQAFDEVLEKHKAENQALVQAAQETLFTSFTHEISRDVVVSPQYFKDKVREINDRLWQVTKYFFAAKDGYTCEDGTRTLRVGITPAKVFTGTRLGRREYSMDDRSLPKSGWYTIVSPLAGNILGEIFWRGIPDRGEVVVEGPLEPCTLAYYQVEARGTRWDSWSHYVFTGKTQSGARLSDEECRRIMDLSVAEFSTSGRAYGRRAGLSKPKEAVPFDRLINPELFITETLRTLSQSRNEEIDKLKAYTVEAKVDLERRLDTLRHQIKEAESALAQAADPDMRLEAQKVLNTKRQELQAAEQNLFLDKMRLEADLEKKTEEITNQIKLTAEVKRIFIVTFKGER